jgi:hypothetical protein
MYYGNHYYGSRHDNTFKRIRKAVYSTWFLIEPFGAHRLSAGVAFLFSIIVWVLSFILISPGHMYAIFFWVASFITLPIMSSLCCGFSNPGKISEILTICKCQLVFHTDIHIFFSGQNQPFSGSCGSLLVVLLQGVLASQAFAVDPSNLVRVVQTVR